MSGSMTSDEFRGVWLGATFRRGWPLAVFSADLGERKLHSLERNSDAAHPIIARRGWIAVTVGGRVYSLRDHQWDVPLQIAAGNVCWAEPGGDPDTLIVSTPLSPLPPIRGDESEDELEELYEGYDDRWQHVVLDGEGEVRRRLPHSSAIFVAELPGGRLLTPEGVVDGTAFEPYTGGRQFRGMVTPHVAQMLAPDESAEFVDLRTGTVVATLPELCAWDPRRSDDQGGAYWGRFGGVAVTADGQVRVIEGAPPEYHFWMDAHRLVLQRPREVDRVIDVRDGTEERRNLVPRTFSPAVEVTDRVDRTQLAALT
ncbi:MAG TPA: hypothetical protein DCR14_19180 [Acidimicrobiaceae bacterium]|nr:hypothetical protein [Acidimicrobiaceae bacterium]